MTRPLLLDLYCGAGGASEGYVQAGFDVVGVDIEPQPHYPYTFIQADALEYLDNEVGYLLENGLAAVHASPPCQAFTAATRIRQNDHPDLIGPTRDALALTGLPYVIENVVGAPLIDPVTLCGMMFPDLAVYRHRLFESNFDIPVPPHPEHVAPITKMGRPPQPGEFMHVVGNFSGVKSARAAMGIDWMTRNELREAIPPAYTRHIATESPVLASLTASEALGGVQ